MLWTGRREKTYDSNFNPHGITADVLGNILWNSGYSVSSIVEAGKKWMAAMVAGGVLILGVMGGITSVVSKHNEEKTENIRQQR